MLPSLAAYALYGWALSRQYMADAGVAVAATQLPDTMDAPRPGVRVDAIIKE